jgi:hypothetical protein
MPYHRTNRALRGPAFTFDCIAFREKGPAFWKKRYLRGFVESSEVISVSHGTMRDKVSLQKVVNRARSGGRNPRALLSSRSRSGIKNWKKDLPTRTMTPWTAVAADLDFEPVNPDVPAYVE